MFDPIYILNKIASIVNPENDLTVEQIVEKIKEKFVSGNTEIQVFVESDDPCIYCESAYIANHENESGVVMCDICKEHDKFKGRKLQCLNTAINKGI